MAGKVTEMVYNRLVQLHSIGLTQEVIGIRLGLSTRTVRLYLQMQREGRDPFKTEVKDVPPQGV